MQFLTFFTWNGVVFLEKSLWWSLWQLTVKQCWAPAFLKKPPSLSRLSRSQCPQHSFPSLHPTPPHPTPSLPYPQLSCHLILLRPGVWERQGLGSWYDGWDAGSAERLPGFNPDSSSNQLFVNFGKCFDLFVCLSFPVQLDGVVSQGACEPRTVLGTEVLSLSCSDSFTKVHTKGAVCCYVEGSMSSLRRGVICCLLLCNKSLQISWIRQHPFLIS